ncbi:MAG: ABC transporter permease, partial [Bacteriovorax sp.]|nr:ABC transporter permease [Rhizobacter sp.]
MPKFVLLWSDAVVLLSVVLLALYLVRVRRSVNLRATWHKVMRDSAALCSAVVLLMFFAAAVVDSVHFRRALAGASAAGALQRQAYATRTESLLDVALARQVAGRETSYSAPLAMRGFTKDTVEVAGKSVRIHPRLQHGGERLTDDTQWAGDVLLRTAIGLLMGLFAAFVLASAVVGVVARAGHRPFVEAWRSVPRNETELPLRAALITVAMLCA